MQIQTRTSPVAKAPVRLATSAATALETATVPTDNFTPGRDAKPKELNPSWAPLAAGGLVAGAVGISSVLTAVGTTTIGPLATGIALPLLVGGGVGYGMYRSGREDNFPIVATVLGSGLAAGIAAFATPFLGMPGAIWGVQGGLVAAGVLGGLAGAGMAVAVARDNKKIREHNARLGFPS